MGLFCYCCRLPVIDSQSSSGGFFILYYFFLLASGKIIATKTKSVAECKHELNMQMPGKRLTIICLVLIRGGSVS